MLKEKQLACRSIRLDRGRCVDPDRALQPRVMLWNQPPLLQLKHGVDEKLSLPRSKPELDLFLSPW